MPDIWSNPLILQGMIAALFLGSITYCTRRWIIRRRMREVEQRIGLYGVVVYADEGQDSASFISKRYGILAKPDFVVRLASGEVVVVEYKNRENGRLYDSDVAQVKATVLAVRSKYKVKRAIVLAGKSRHEISLPMRDINLYAEIAQHVNYVRRANEGEVVMEFTDKTAKCAGCHNAGNCHRD